MKITLEPIKIFNRKEVRTKDTASNGIVRLESQVWWHIPVILAEISRSDRYIIVPCLKKKKN
jgi:hypothetical protein